MRRGREERDAGDVVMSGYLGRHIGITGKGYIAWRVHRDGEGFSR